MFIDNNIVDDVCPLFFHSPPFVYQDVNTHLISDLIFEISYLKNYKYKSFGFFKAEQVAGRH